MVGVRTLSKFKRLTFIKEMGGKFGERNYHKRQQTARDYESYTKSDKGKAVLQWGI